MKKLVFLLMVSVVLVSAVLAIQPANLPLGVGAKYAAMGGAGAATVSDITCAYYNPAGVVKSTVELKIAGGGATAGLNDLLANIPNASDPSKFFANNYNNAVNVNGGLNAFVGLNLAKLGLSVISSGSLNLNKAAATTEGSASGNFNYDGAVTLGSSYAIPGLPIANLDWGVSIKSVNRISASTNAQGNTSTDTSESYTGVGFDIGAIAEVNALVVPIAVGLVYRDLSETLKGKRNSASTTYNPTNGSITSQTKTESTLPDLTSPTTLTIGASTRIPLYNILIAADVDTVSGAGTSYSLTHIGIEYPVLGILLFRAGSVSGANDTISQTTIGAGLDLGLGLNVAMVTDNKNSKNNQALFDFGFAF